MKGSYYYVIEVEQGSPLDQDIQCKLTAAIYGQDKRGYRDYFRVTASSIPEAVGRILVNQRLLNQVQSSDGFINSRELISDESLSS